MASDKLFWVECNLCPAEGQILHLTECGHIYCFNCLEKLKSNNNKCVVCKMPTSFQRLDDSLPDNIKDYFKPTKISPVADMLSKFQKMDTFHKNQIQLFVRNNVKKQVLLKNRLQNAHGKIQKLLKELSIKDECIKKNEEEKRVLVQASANSFTSKISTPNSNCFIGGILKTNSRSHPMLVTSTPFERINTPMSVRPRPSPMPTPFITPNSQNSSVHKESLITHDNGRRTPSSSFIHRPPIYIQNNATPNNQGRCFNSTSRLTQSKFKTPPIYPSDTTKMGQSKFIPGPSPAQMSYKSLLQDRINTGAIRKDGFRSATFCNSQSTSSIQLNSVSKLNVNSVSHIQRKRRNVQI